jgi:hypothetical protein
MAASSTSTSTGTGSCAAPQGKLESVPNSRSSTSFHLSASNVQFIYNKYDSLHVFFFYQLQLPLAQRGIASWSSANKKNTRLINNSAKLEVSAEQP